MKSVSLDVTTPSSLLLGCPSSVTQMPLTSLVACKQDTPSVHSSSGLGRWGVSPGREKMRFLGIVRLGACDFYCQTTRNMTFLALPDNKEQMFPGTAMPGR